MSDMRCVICRKTHDHISGDHVCVGNLQDEIERLESENFKLHERVCNAENELSDKNKRNKALRKVIASHKDRLTVASLDLEDDLIAANLGWKD